MQELGVWTTAEGATPARLQLESEEALPAWASGALQGAAAGAATGAVAGGYGALVGAGIGAILGATSATTPPSSSSSPSPSPSPSAAPASGPAPTTQAAGDSSSRARAILALQQFAAAVPILVQLLSASGGGGSESAPGYNGASHESFQEGDWGPESFQGTWTIP